LSLAWLTERRGLEALGDEVDFKLVVKMLKASDVHRVFYKQAEEDGLKRMTPEDWTLITETLAIIEEWDAR
jgi:hypothetical protein